MPKNLWYSLITTGINIKLKLNNRMTGWVVLSLPRNKPFFYERNFRCLFGVERRVDYLISCWKGKEWPGRGLGVSIINHLWKYCFILKLLPLLLLPLLANMHLFAMCLFVKKKNPILKSTIREKHSLHLTKLKVPHLFILNPTCHCI